MSTRQGYEDGEIIEIWDCPETYLMGHIDDVQAVHDTLIANGAMPRTISELRETYMRVIPDSTGEYDFRYYESGRGRGAFPVTEVIWL